MPKQSFGEAEVSGEELHEILKEIDTNMNGQVELDEYLQVGYVQCARKNWRNKEQIRHVSTTFENRTISMNEIWILPYGGFIQCQIKNGTANRLPFYFLLFLL